MYMLENNLISVIIPCYNSSKTIKRAITSVISQTHKNTEIICIDDGSSDDTVNILNTLSQSIANLTILINDKNRGPSYSRNKGVLHSSGDFIAFLDSDDYWHTDKLSLQLCLLNQYSLDFIAGTNKFNLDEFSNNKNTPPKITKITLKKLLFKNYFVTSTVLMKREFFIPFDEQQRYSEDYKAWLKIMIDKKALCAVVQNPPLNGVIKEAYGESGLSSNLWQMEKYELKNYIELLKQGCLLTLIAIPLSFIKYVKRLCVTRLKK